MKPLLAHTYEPHRLSFPCYVQPKLNGIRALSGTISGQRHFQSRDEIPWNRNVLLHIATALENLLPDNVLTDGELYVHGWPLQRINGAVTPVRQEANEDTVQVQYHIFDVIDSTEAFSQRYKRKFDLVVVSDCPIQPVPTLRVHDEDEANALYANFVAQGYEGMMYRLGDCPYTAPKQPRAGSLHVPNNTRSPFLSDQDNRCWHLLKRKDWHDAEFTCIGIQEGREGKYESMVGALVCAVGNGDTFTVSGGLTDHQRILYWEQPSLIVGTSVKVKFLLYSTAGIPLNPTLL